MMFTRWGQEGYRAPAVAGTRGGTRRLRGRSHGLWYYARRPGWQPHQGHRERLRRLWQVHEGQLAGPGLVTDGARYTAHGLLPPGARLG